MCQSSTAATYIGYSGGLVGEGEIERTVRAKTTTICSLPHHSCFSRQDMLWKHGSSTSLAPATHLSVTLTLPS